MIEFEQIICPVNFSESSVRALAYAAALARWYDAPLTVPHGTDRTKRLRDEQEIAAVMEVAARAIPTKRRPSAFAIVADLLLVDGKIDARERKFLRRLVVDFNIRARMASHVVEAMLVTNHF